MLENTIYSRTPTVKVLDNRGLVVREVSYYRHPESLSKTETRISKYHYDSRGFLTENADPRLAQAGLMNFTYLTDLTGSALRTWGTDSGLTVSLHDIASRSVLEITGVDIDKHNGEDRSQAVVRTWQYEDSTLPGRLLSVTEKKAGENECIVERFIWGGNTPEEKSDNLAGQCISHYDTAGLVQTESIALRGVALSVSRRLLKEAADPKTIINWQGPDAAAWDDFLNNDRHITVTSVDATGAIIASTDATGNRQRMTYDVGGRIKGSWLIMKGSSEQIIVKSLTYSAAGEKLREEHGNGVVTLYSYDMKTQRLMGKKIERRTELMAESKIVQDLHYEYDPVGNLLNIRNDAEKTIFWRNQKVVPQNTYTYDSLYQLVSASGREMAAMAQLGKSSSMTSAPLSGDSSAYVNYTRTYDYDSGGNLTQIRHSAPASGNNYTTKITVSNRSNRAVLSLLTEDPEKVDTLFAARGYQKTLLPGQELAWTVRGELQHVTPVKRNDDNDDTESYRYDGESQRLIKTRSQKTSGGMQIQQVLYLHGLEIRTMTYNGTEKEQLHVINIGQTKIRALYWESGLPSGLNNEQVHYSYDNMVGSGALDMDKHGEIISKEEYYPYGGTSVWLARNQIESDYKTVRYSGKEQDATGLYYYGYRYYQPWVGRWLSSDPAGTIDGLNLYRMVHNNPVTFRDTDGRVPVNTMPAPHSSSNGEMSASTNSPSTVVNPTGDLNLSLLSVTSTADGIMQKTQEWTEAEKDRKNSALNDYTGRFYIEMNLFLREKRVKYSNDLGRRMVSQGYWPGTPEDLGKNKAALNQVMTRYTADATDALSFRAESDHSTVFRGIDLDVNGLEKVRENLVTEGETFSETGFMSTSPTRGWIKDTILRIHLYAGHPGRILKDESGNASKFNEDEMLFPPGMRFKVETVFANAGRPSEIRAFNKEVAKLELRNVEKHGVAGIKRIIDLRLLKPGE